MCSFFLPLANFFCWTPVSARCSCVGRPASGVHGGCRPPLKSPSSCSTASPSLPSACTCWSPSPPRRRQHPGSRPWPSQASQQSVAAAVRDPLRPAPRLSAQRPPRSVHTVAGSPNWSGTTGSARAPCNRCWPRRQARVRPATPRRSGSCPCSRAALVSRTGRLHTRGWKNRLPELPVP